MSRIGEIAEFNSSDGLTPWQVRKLNANFRAIERRLPDASIVEVDRVETLQPGQQAYVEDVGSPPITKLRFGIPRGEKGDKGDKGDSANLEWTRILDLDTTSATSYTDVTIDFSAYHDLLFMTPGGTVLVPKVALSSSFQDFKTTQGTIVRLKASGSSNVSLQDGYAWTAYGR